MCKGRILFAPQNPCVPKAFAIRLRTGPSGKGNEAKKSSRDTRALRARTFAAHAAAFSSSPLSA